MRDMTRFLGATISGVLSLIIIIAAMSGGLVSPDEALRDLRFSAGQRGVTGSVVFVDIDSKSLETVGVWPWPRHVHALLLDKLMALGSSDVAFDIDFSIASSEPEDEVLAQSLEAAGGYAHLAAFQQQKTAGGPAGFNLPLPKFRAFADPVTVNVALDSGGVVRTYPYAMDIGGHSVPSIASLLSGINGPEGGGFNIDYSINPAGIDRISAADLLSGEVDGARVAGKQVVVGASALELRDYFVVPRFGALPGALLQALATETLKQGRALQPFSSVPVAIVVGLLGLVAMLFRRRMPLVLAIVAPLAISAAAEALALLLQLNQGILISTAAIHLAVATFIVGALIAEMVARGQQRLNATRERDAVRVILDRVITDNFDGVIVVNADGQIVSASAFAETMLGQNLTGKAAKEVLPQTFAQLLAEPSGRQGEFVFVRGAEKRIIEYVVTYSQVRLTAAASLVVCLTFRDVTDRRAAEDRLRFIGDHDVLTGALSRTKLVQMIESAVSQGQQVSVVVVDLRRFRLVNASLGHGQGDLVLKQVASRLKSMGPDAVARLGGISFAMLVPAMPPDRLEGFAQTITRLLAFPFELADGHSAIITASAGATTSLMSGDDAETLLSHADMALSVAKQLPGNGVALFEPSMDDRLRDSQSMDAALRQALADDQFTLAFQPQVKLTTGEIVGAEALARWIHPTLGPVSPERFVPAAEETGLIVALGRWALSTACREAVRWSLPLKVAVNVSPVQFELADVIEDIQTALRDSGLPAERLEIEITEGIFVKNFASIVERLTQIRAMGVSVALDDFGTGYSSLSYLGRLPVDKMKIDQSFVKRLPMDAEAAAIVRTIVALGLTLGKRIIAEGVETPDQAWMLDIAGCELAQGFHFGRPMPTEEFATRLAEPPKRLAAG